MNIPDGKIIKELISVASSNEGALLNNPSSMGKLEQLNFFFNLFLEIKPKRIIEIGTNKGLFDLFVLHNFPDTIIYTCDLVPFSLKAVEILLKIFPQKIFFENVKSTDYFKKFDPSIPIDFAWVDGGHNYSNCLEDLINCAKLKIRAICVDDYRMLPEVNKAMTTFLSSYPYKITKTSEKIDDRGIALLERTTI